MKLRDKKILSFTIAVAVALSSIPVNTTFAKSKTSLPKKITVIKGKSKTIKIKNYKRVSKKKVKWKSSDKNIVTVKAKGKYNQSAVLKGKKSGTAIVTVKVRSEKYKCKVTVKVVR